MFRTYVHIDSLKRSHPTSRVPILFFRTSLTSSLREPYCCCQSLSGKKINKWSFTDSSCLLVISLTLQGTDMEVWIRFFFSLLLPLMSVCSIAFHWKNTSAYNMYACSMWCFQIQWDHTNGVFSNDRGFLLGAKHLIFEAEYALESIYIFCKKYSST